MAVVNDFKIICFQRNGKKRDRARMCKYVLRKKAYQTELCWAQRRRPRLRPFQELIVASTLACSAVCPCVCSMSALFFCSAPLVCLWPVLSRSLWNCLCVGQSCVLRSKFMFTEDQPLPSITLHSIIHAISLNLQHIKLTVLSVTVHYNIKIFLRKFVLNLATNSSNYWFKCWVSYSTAEQDKEVFRYWILLERITLASLQLLCPLHLIHNMRLFQVVWIEPLGLCCPLSTRFSCESGAALETYRILNKTSTVLFKVNTHFIIYK